MKTTRGKSRSAIAAETTSSSGGASRLSTVIFGLLCFLPIFATLLFGAVDTITWVLIFFVWAAIVLCWLGECWNAGGAVVNTSSIQLPVIGLLCVGLLHLLPVVTTSIEPNSTRFFVARLVVFLTFFAACLAFINTEKRLTRIVTGVVIFGAVMAFLGILQRLATPEGIYGMRETPFAVPFGPFVNQHHFAAFMQMAGGVTLGLLFDKEMSREKRVLFGGAMVVMAVAVALTGSRGGLLGFLAVTVFVIGINFLPGPVSRSGEAETGRRKFALIAGALAIAVVTLGAVLFLGGNEQLLRGIGAVNAEVDVSGGRLHFWPVALSIFLEHPVLGAGLDSFAVAFTKHDSWAGFLRVDHAHNEYLHMLAEAGLAGIAAVGAFIYLLFSKGLNVISNSDGFRRSAAIGALGGCFGLLIHSFFDFPLRTHSNSFFFLLLVVIATVSVEQSSRSRRRHRTT
ncbi:MAG: O-antigen ligase family protein [Pyrinomonadaceae bacterium]